MADNSMNVTQKNNAQATEEQWWQTQRKAVQAEIVEAAKAHGCFPWEQADVRLQQPRLVSAQKNEGWRLKVGFQEVRNENILYLMAAAAKNGYSSGLWMDKDQINALGGSIKKGEHGVRIENWKFRSPKIWNPETEKMETVLIEGKDGKMVPAPQKWECLRLTVFNIEQTRGIPEKIRAGLEQKDRIELSEDRKNNLSLIHNRPAERDEFYQIAIQQTLKDDDFTKINASREALTAGFSAALLKGRGFNAPAPDKEKFKNQLDYLTAHPDQLFRIAKDAARTVQFIDANPSLEQEFANDIKSGLANEAQMEHGVEIENVGRAQNDGYGIE